MSGKEDIRSWAGIPSHRAALSGEVYEPDRHGRGHDRFIRSIRKGSIVEVVDLMWLAGPGRADKRRRQLVAHVEAICAKGARIREVSTGDETPKHKSRMLMRAFEMIGRTARGLRSAENGRLSKGRPTLADQLSEEQKKAIRGIWESRKYKTGDAALAAIHALGLSWIKRGWVYRHFGKRD